MVIFEGKRLNPEWTKGEVPCTLYGMSDKRWMDMELFSYWLKDLFLPSIPPARPVLLLLDGHSSHYEPETIRYAASQDVVVLCLPPHTTHVSQPLDVSFFKPLKSYWSEVCHRYIQDNPGRVVTKYQFSSLFSRAWYRAIRPETIVNGFRKVGVCPFDSTAITVPDVPTSKDPDDTGEAPGDTGADQGGNESDDSGNADLSAECGLTEETESHVMDVNDDDAAPTLTPAELELFETRYENGYVYTLKPNKSTLLFGTLSPIPEMGFHCTNQWFAFIIVQVQSVSRHKICYLASSKSPGRSAKHRR